MVGVLSNGVDRQDVKAGDHMYSWRTTYIYTHHGIYVGDGMVIHFTRAAGHEIGTGTFLDWFLFSSSSPAATADGSPCQKCGHLMRRQGVIMSCLDCFLDGGSLYLFDYAVPPAFFLAKARGGTCTLAASDPCDIVIHRARFLLDNGFGMYCLFKNNCEDFAIYCKTGLLVETAFSVGHSGQLASLTAAFSAMASLPLCFLTTSAGGLAILTGGLYCMGRYVSDIGVRPDVVVPVEGLWSTGSTMLLLLLHLKFGLQKQQLPHKASYCLLLFIVIHVPERKGTTLIFIVVCFLFLALSCNPRRPLYLYELKLTATYDSKICQRNLVE